MAFRGRLQGNNNGSFGGTFCGLKGTVVFLF